MKSLKEFRQNKGVTQSAVANYLGVSRATYARYEAHQDVMSISQAYAVCDFLGCSVNDIFLPSKVKQTNI